MAKNVNDWLKHLSREISPLSESANLDAQVLLAHVVERPRSWILAHPEAVLTDDNEDELQESIDRLKSGVPLPYVLGHWEFFGLAITLSPDTLIPRPETEVLLETVLETLGRGGRVRARRPRVRLPVRQRGVAHGDGADLPGRDGRDRHHHQPGDVAIRCRLFAGQSR